MFLTLIRHTSLLLLLCLGLGIRPAQAVHLLGGEMSYKYLDANGPGYTPWRYQVTVRLYYNPLTDPEDSRIDIRIRNSNSQPFSALVKESVTRKSSTLISTPPLPGCSQVVPSVALGLYEVIVNLPEINDSFEAYCIPSNRVAGITNVLESVKTSMVLSVTMTPPTIPNSSPVFSNIPVALICLGSTNTVPNNAYDADGDQLVYRISTPLTNYLGNLLFVPYPTGYSASQPFGINGEFSVDPVSGISSYRSMEQGVFQLAIDVDEYRVIDGQKRLLSTTHRDVQVVARACSGGPNQAPYFTPASLAQPNLQIQEGQALAFNVTAVDPEGHALTLTANSVLLDGPGGINATFGNLPGASIANNPAGQSSVRGIGTVTGTIRLSGCIDDRRTRYDVLVTATDEECNSQTIATTFHITVGRASFMGTIQGPRVLACAQGLATYTVTSTPAYAAYQWTVQGGEIFAPSTGPSVRVLWGNNRQGVVRVAGIASSGCPTIPLDYPVTMPIGVSVAGPTTYCPTAATGLRFHVDGPPARYQWNITNGSITNGNGTNDIVIEVSPPGATAILTVALAGSGSCVKTLRLPPDDYCLAFYNVITPNGDGQNDIFAIGNVARHPNTALTIFNRWGRQVFQASDYRNTFGDAQTAPGMYYYRCIDAEGTVYKGWFEVMR